VKRCNQPHRKRARQKGAIYRMEHQIVDVCILPFEKKEQKKMISNIKTVIENTKANMR
jgi:hypothetical protein